MRKRKFGGFSLLGKLLSLVVIIRVAKNEIKDSISFPLSVVG
jgi:hypothetical protein